jgi:hypothetical protein
MNQVLIYMASAIATLWGIAHLAATKGVVEGFGEISEDNRLIITMEWIVEGVAFISIAAFVAVVTAIDMKSAVSTSVYLVAICSLIALALVARFTGAKVDFLPFKLCPFVLGLSALLIACGVWI